MQDELRLLLNELGGEHTYDRGARLWNWFVIWVFLVLPVVVGAFESLLRGWKTIQLTPLFWFASACSVTIGVFWIRAFNQTHYRIENGVIECLRGWPRKSWKVFVEDVETINIEPFHGNWVLVLKLRSGGRRRIVLTKSMRAALHLT